MRNVHYISQTGTSGYANASKGYVYDLIKNGINVKWTTFLCDQSLSAETSEFDTYINKYRVNNIPDDEIDTVIIHSTPDLWKKIIEDLKIDCENKKVVGRTVWEFNKLIPEWVDAINTSKVTEVSVPTKWNKDTFESSKVSKPITVDPHININYPYKSYDIKHILENKSTIIYNGKLEEIDFNSVYKFYTIGQLIPRKGILETISAFCKTFTQRDNVILFVKTFKLDYSYEQQVKCLEEIVNCIRTNSINENYPPIIFVKENLTYDELQSLHDICDCYVQLTKTEGFGLGIFEAFNKKKDIIVTGHGGQVEFLGENYDGLVDFELKPINNENRRFFQFDLDESYTWADVSIDHSVSKMRELCIRQIMIGDGFYDLEKESDSYFKWTSNLFELYADLNINEITLDYLCEYSDFKIKCNGKEETLLFGRNKIKFNSTSVNYFECDYFVPSKIKKSNDNRRLSIRIYGIEIKRLSGIKTYVPINIIPQKDSVSELKSSEILFVQFKENKGGAEKVFDKILTSIDKNRFQLINCIKNGNNTKYWKQKFCGKYLSNYNDLDSIKKDIRIICKNKFDLVYGNTLQTLKLLFLLKKYNESIKSIIHIHEMDSAFHIIEKDFINNKIDFKNALKSINKIIVVCDRTKKILLENYEIDPTCIEFINDKL